MALVCVVFTLLTINGSQANIVETVRDKLRETPLTLDTTLIDFNFNDLIKAEFDIGIGVRQNRDKNTYSRSEKITLNRRLGKAFGDDLVFNSFIRGESEIEFVRQFDSQVAAFNVVQTPPYTPEKIPYNARRAKSLNPGDYVRFNTQLSLQVSPAVAHSFGITSISGAISYVLHGDFQLELYKKDDNKHLLRASTLKSDTFSASLAYRPTNALQVFGVISRENRIGKALIPSTFASASSSITHGNLLTIEYEYNLPSTRSSGFDTNPAVLAFNEVVNPNNWVQDTYEVLTSERTLEGTAQAILVRFDRSEELASQASGESFHVKRSSRSEASFVNRSRQFKLDLTLVDGRRRLSLVDQDFTFQGEDGFWRKYKITNLVKNREFNFFRVFGLKESREANAILELDNTGAISEFKSLSFSFSRDERTRLENELGRIQGQIHRMMPESFHSRLSIAELITGFLTRNTRVDLELVFHSEAWDLASRLTQAEVLYMVNLFFDLINDDDVNNRNRKYGTVHVRNGGQDREDEWIVRAVRQLPEIREKLPLILGSDSPLSNDQRYELFLSLRRNIVFFQLAPGLFTRILQLARGTHAPDSEFSDYVSFRLSATAEGLDPVSVTIGDFERTQAIKDLLKSRNRILNRQFDPCLFENIACP